MQIPTYELNLGERFIFFPRLELDDDNFFDDDWYTLLERIVLEELSTQCIFEEPIEAQGGLSFPFHSIKEWEVEEIKKFNNRRYSSMTIQLAEALEAEE